jgi:Fe2+ or Zn2+ uptake regulation protein
MIKQSRYSKQREQIYNTVLSSKSHPTADEVYSATKELIPDISLGTVYRNLRLLVGQGKLKEVIIDGSSVSRFDPMTVDHEHFVCTKCGRIEDLEPTMSEASYPDISARLGGRVTSHKLSYFGICSRCLR